MRRTDACPSYPAKAGYPVRCGLSIQHGSLWNTGSPAFAGDDRQGCCTPMRQVLSDSDVKQRVEARSHACAISPRVFARVLLESSAPSNMRAQGKPGARCARGLAGRKKAAPAIVTTVTPETPGIPRAMVLRLTPGSPRRPGLFATVAPKKLEASQELDASVGASGPHGFAVRLDATRLDAPKRPSHPAPNVRDDRETPLMWARDGASYRLICVFGKTEIFCERGWTGGPKRAGANQYCPYAARLTSSASAR